MIKWNHEWGRVMKKINIYMIISILFTSAIATVYLADFFFGFLQNPYLFVADMMIIALLLLILGIGFFYHNLAIKIGASLLIILMLLHMVISMYSIFSMLDILLVWSEIMLLIFIIVHIVLQVKKNIVFFNTSKLNEDLSRTVFLRYDVRTEMLTLTFSDAFRKYYSFEKKEMILDLKTYTSFLAKEDQPKVETVLNHFDAMTKTLETTVRYRFPGLNQEVAFNIRLVKDGRYEILGIQNDITEVDNLNLLIKNKDVELEQLEKEYKTIMTHTSEMILRLDKAGTILFATESFKALFDETNIIGHSILKLNQKLTGKYSERWFKNILGKNSTKGFTEFMIDGKRRYYFWQNDVIKDQEGSIDYIISIGRDVTDIQKLNQRLEFSTTHDEQTGLFNRQGLYKIFEERLKEKALTFFYLEIRDFVMINEFYGVDKGTELLNILSDRLKSFTRQSGYVIHLGNEKFLLVIEREEMNPNELLNRLNKKLAKTFYTTEAKISVTIDAGYAFYPEDSKHLNQVIGYATLAMEHARKNNDGNIYTFETNLLESANEQFNLTNRIKAAIDHKEINIAYQGIYDALSDEIVHVEALMRFSVDGQSVSPEKVLQLAKDKGLTLKLDRYLITEALKRFKVHQRNGFYKNAILNINLAPQSLIDENFADTMVKLAQRYDYNVSDICLEITENSFVDYNLNIFNQMKRLKEQGFMIALDDFGKEYSSLSVLNEFDFDVVKIDKTFIQQLSNPVNITIITMIDRIAKIKKSSVIAEGIETKAQSKALIEMGCHIQQGYYFMIPKL